MENFFVSYETALILKEKGFNEPCLAWYYSDRSGLGKLHLEYSEPNTKYHLNAPTYDQVTSWLRENSKINIQIFIGHDENKIWYNFDLMPIQLGYNYEPHTCNNEAKETYYEAINKAIEESLKFI